MSTNSDQQKVAETFVSAISENDFDQLRDTLQEDVRFRAFTPNHTFGMFGSDAVTAVYRGWFGEGEPIRPLLVECTPVMNRFRFRYQLDLAEGDRRVICDQQGYCTVEDGVITDLVLTCAGMLPREE